MGDLVSSGQGEEASALDELSEQHSEILAKYGLFVTAVLDHIEGMLLGQVRKVIEHSGQAGWEGAMVVVVLSKMTSI